MLATGNFSPELVALPGEFSPSEHFASPPASSRGTAATAPPQATGATPPPWQQQTYKRTWVVEKTRTPLDSCRSGHVSGSTERSTEQQIRESTSRLLKMATNFASVST